MEGLLFPLRIYHEWTSVPQCDPRWLTVEKHLWNSKDKVQDVIRKAGGEGVRFVEERTASGKHIVFSKVGTDYREIQKEFFAHLEELEKNAEISASTGKVEEAHDECSCEFCEGPIGWGFRLSPIVVVVVIALVVGFVIFH